MEDSQSDTVSIGAVKLIVIGFVLFLGALFLWGNGQILMFVLGGFSLAVLMMILLSRSCGSFFAAAICAVLTGPRVFREREYDIFQPEFYMNLPHPEVTRWEILGFACCAGTLIGMAIRFLVLRLSSKFRSEVSAEQQTEMLTLNAGEN